MKQEILKRHNLEYITSITRNKIFQQTYFLKHGHNLSQRNSLRGFPIVIVDNSMCYSSEELEDIYTLCANADTELIVLT